MTFNQQAAKYDKRAGLPEGVPQKIAATVASIIKLPSPGNLLEIGAGTGEIGCELRKLSISYTGFDLSEKMLEVYRKRCSNAQGKIFVANGEEKWPVEDHSTNAFFSSRAIHLLNTEHVVKELRRAVAPQGGVLIIGKIEREKNSVTTIMKRKMQQMLKKYDIRPRDGARQNKLIFDTFCEKSHENAMTKHIAATWQVFQAPFNSIQSWKGKAGMAGVDVDKKAKAAVLEELEKWAKQHFGNIQKTIESTEQYILESVSFK